MTRLHDALSLQVEREFMASQQYVAVAVYYDSETLPQLAAHFYRQAIEERNHAMMIVKYLLDADEEVEVPGVPAPTTGFEGYIQPVQMALEQEKKVTEQFVDLIRIAREDGDIVAEQFLYWFLEEQREEVAAMADLLKVVERAAPVNILLAEDFLSRQSVGDNGDATNAPPVAGGQL